MFKIWNAKKEEENCYLQLVEDSDAGIVVRIVNKDGSPIDCGLIVSFEPNGKLKLLPGINSEVKGISRTGSGRIQVE